MPDLEPILKTRDELFKQLNIATRAANDTEVAHLRGMLIGIDLALDKLGLTESIKSNT